LNCCTSSLINAFDRDTRKATSPPAFRHRTFFVGTDMRGAVKQGLVEYVPMSVARVPEMIELGRIPVDVALIQVSLPDAFGFVSLGVSVDIIPAAVARARAGDCRGQPGHAALAWATPPCTSAAFTTWCRWTCR
jgi:acyl-CoA hydrolase